MTMTNMFFIFMYLSQTAERGQGIKEGKLQQMSKEHEQVYQLNYTAVQRNIYDFLNGMFL